MTAKVFIAAHVDPDVAARLRQHAVACDRSVASMIRLAICEWLERHDQAGAR